MTNVLPAPVQEEWPPAVKTFSLTSKLVYRDEDIRFDATTYSQDYYAALQMIEQCRFPKTELRTLVGRVYHPTENQARSNFKRIWVKRVEGVPFLTGRQLFFFRPDKERFLSPKMEKFHELIVPKGTILLSRSGTTGYPVLVGDWLSKFAVTDDAIRIFPGEEPLGFVYAFLASRVGRALLTKNEYGSTVSHLEAKHVKNLPVPLPPSQARQRIHEKVAEAYSLRDRANGILDEASAELHGLIGVSPFDESDVRYLGGGLDARAFAVSSSELFDRLDATHHVPIARSAEQKLRNGKYPLVRLGERVDRVYVAPRFARVYVESAYGTPLLQGSHIPAIRPLELKYISNQNTLKMSRWIIRRGCVLVTCSGTIGRTAVVTSGQDGWAASQHALRIMPKAGVTHEGFIAAFISTPYGQHQLKSKIYGGVVDELTAEDTEVIWIPDVPFPDQAPLGEKVVHAYEMRDEANRIEDEAVSKLEALIAAR